MNLSQDLIQHVLIGFAAATALYWWKGWLRFPSQGGVSPPPPVPANLTHIQGQEVAAPSYKSMSNIPFEVAITPQNQVK